MLTTPIFMVDNLCFYLYNICNQIKQIIANCKLKTAQRMIYMKMSTKTLTQCAVFSAIISILSVITIPIGIIPVTLGLFGIMLAAIILGCRRSVLSVLIFILIGAVGIPVFSGFKGGPQVLTGPTGGYITSYIFVSMFIGFISDKVKSNGILSAVILFLACCFGTVICYTLGTLQFMAISGNDIKTALAKCVTIFIPFDILKSVMAAFIGTAVKKRLRFFN